MSVFQIKHFYSRIDGFYAIETSLSLSEINLACAYLQMLRFDLPMMMGTEDEISEDYMCILLQHLYKVKVMPHLCYIDGQIDLYENWQDFCQNRGEYFVEQINTHFAKCGAYKAILKIMLSECVQSVEELKSYSGDSDQNFDPKHYLIKVKENITYLKSLIEGNKVESHWGLDNLAGKSLTGIQFVTNFNAPDYLDR